MFHISWSAMTHATKASRYGTVPPNKEQRNPQGE
jgi:hypothetical protein